MDILQNLKNHVEDTRDSELRSRIIMELSEKKYNLQKKLRDDTMRLSEKKSSLLELRKEVVNLGHSYVMLEKKEEIALELVKDLTKQVVIQEKATEKIQAIYWKKINDFVSKSVQHLKKHPPAVKKQVNNNGDRGAIEKNNKIREFELQGRFEAMKAFEKYQSKKIKELALLKKMLDV